MGLRHLVVPAKLHSFGALLTRDPPDMWSARFCARSKSSYGIFMRLEFPLKFLHSRPFSSSYACRYPHYFKTVPHGSLLTTKVFSPTSSMPGLKFNHGVKAGTATTRSNLWFFFCFKRYALTSTPTDKLWGREKGNGSRQSRVLQTGVGGGSLE